MNVRVLVDASVLASRALRDWLLLLRDEAGESSPFTLVYTEDLVAETIKAIRRMHPALEGRDITRIHDKIVQFMDDRIEDYRSGQDEERIKDVFDRHVHAAAVAGADVVITADKGFLNLSEETKDGLPYVIYSADEWLQEVDDYDRDLVIRVLERQIAYRTGSRQHDFDFPKQLEEAGCTGFAERIRQCLRELALRGGR
jgi:predicted nucleic acid-binding protein